MVIFDRIVNNPYTRHIYSYPHPGESTDDLRQVGIMKAEDTVARSDIERLTANKVILLCYL